MKAKQLTVGEQSTGLSYRFWLSVISIVILICTTVGSIAFAIGDNSSTIVENTLKSHEEKFVIILERMRLADMERARILVNIEHLLEDRK